MRRLLRRSLSAETSRGDWGRLRRARLKAQLLHQRRLRQQRRHRQRLLFSGKNAALRLADHPAVRRLQQPNIVRPTPPQASPPSPPPGPPPPQQRQVQPPQPPTGQPPQRDERREHFAPGGAPGGPPPQQPNIVRPTPPQVHRRRLHRAAAAGAAAARPPPVRRRSNSACSRRHNPVHIRRHRRHKVRVGPDSLHRGLLPRGRRPSRARRRKNSVCSKVRRENETGGLVAARLRLFVSAGQCISTLRNCHGSRLSMSSGKSPGRPVRGVQSVYVPMTGPR